MKPSLRIGLLALTAGLSACAAKPPAVESPEEYCDRLNRLVAEYSTGFESIKGAQTHTRYADIWEARFNAVGDGCQIWASGKGALHYVCTRPAPNADVAKEYYDKGVGNIGQCLGPQWQAKESELQAGANYMTRFTSATNAASVVVQRTESRAAFGTQWTLFYMVGNIPAQK